ncbi:MAG: sulfotransferase family protein [Proteobacteria bacterium]|nr:MAG: sulfotransferase family protein [Pseudomonadota bacterium]
MRRFVTVVTGLPRSGTSLAMQMLRAGGIPLLADERRAPDADNPRGYFEYEPVRRLARDAGWMAEAVGRAVKVVAPLARHLPPGFEYRVLLVRRDLAEVIASQERMLARRGEPNAGGLAPERLAAVLAAQLAETAAFFARSAGVRTLPLEHAALLRDPAAAAAAIDAFLGGGLDRAAMCAVVEPALHRERR